MNDQKKQLDTPRSVPKTVDVSVVQSPNPLTTPVGIYVPNNLSPPAVPGTKWQIRT